MAPATGRCRATRFGQSRPAIARCRACAAAGGARFLCKPPHKPQWRTALPSLPGIFLPCPGTRPGFSSRSWQRMGTQASPLRSRAETEAPVFSRNGARTARFSLFGTWAAPGQLWAWREGSEPEKAVAIDGDLSMPQWSFNAASYALLPEGRAYCTFVRNGEAGAAIAAPWHGRRDAPRDRVQRRTCAFRRRSGRWSSKA